jgi:arabinose-5-phosphate isomerase
MIVDDAGGLAGLFTDSDLARIFERRDDAALDSPIERVMTPRPTTIPLGTRLRDAVAILEARRLSELPVIDHDGRPHGLLDIVDLVGLVAPEAVATPATGAAAA